MRCSVPCGVPDACSALPALRSSRAAQEALFILEEAQPQREPQRWLLLWAGHLNQRSESKGASLPAGPLQKACFTDQQPTAAESLHVHIHGWPQSVGPVEELCVCRQGTKGSYCFAFSNISLGVPGCASLPLLRLSFHLSSSHLRDRGHADNTSVPEEERFHNDTNLPSPFIYQMTVGATGECRTEWSTLSY